MAQILTFNEFEEKVVNTDKIVLLDFWKEGCGPCAALAPEFEKVLSENPDLTGYSINIESEPELVDKLRVMAAPTLLVLRNGAVKKKSLGFKTAEHILEMVEAAKQ